MSSPSTRPKSASKSPPLTATTAPQAVGLGATEEEQIEPEQQFDDVASETDSAFGEDNASFTTSLRSEVVNYVYENGRRYHAFGNDRYWIPNDETESDRLDICAHMFSLLLRGELHLAPINPHPQRILDLGTGTGIWAIDMAEKYPSADVIGNDISATQPQFVPPNVRFEVDDFEQPWVFSSKFDYIHARYLCGAVKDWPKLIQQAFEYTKPGGWVEFMDFGMTFETVQGEYKPGCAIEKWTTQLKGVLQGFGLEAEPGPKLEGWIKDAGFQNLEVTKFALPVGMWPKDRRWKQIGTANLIQFLENLEGFSLRPLSSLGWEIEEIKVFIAQVRKEFKDPRFQLQHEGYIVIGQKPGVSQPEDLS